MGGFHGFSDGTIDFLWELRMNNSKAWMDENRERYKEVLKEPFDDLGWALAERLAAVSGEELSWSVSRINRDIRYSKDKSPYRSCRWLVLKEPLVQGTGWKSRPVFYFELSPEGYVYGMGFYEATPGYMKAYRERIMGDVAGFSKLVGKIEKAGTFQLTGEDYKRVGGEALPTGIRPWFTKKHFAVIGHGGIDEVLFGDGLVDMLIAQWEGLLPLQAYLRGIQEEQE